MKRLFLTSALVCTVMFAYAQKAELDAAQKALDKKDYNTAIEQATKAEALLKQDKEASSSLYPKAMYIAGMAKLGLAGDDIPKIKEALKSLTAVTDFERGKDYSARSEATKKTVYFNTQKELDDAMISGQYSKPKVADRTQVYTPMMNTAVGEAGNGYYRKSVEVYNNGKYKEAADLFVLTYEAQKIFAPKADTALLNNAATCLLQVRDFTGAANIYKELLDMGYTGIETIYEATDALSGQKKMYSSKKDMDAQVKLKLATDPSTRVEPNKQPEVYLRLIQILYQAEQYDQAMEYAVKAMEKYPDNKDFYLILGQIYYQKKDMDKFQGVLLAAEKMFPTDAEIEYNLGYVYGEKKDSEKAVQHYKKALEIDPKYANAYINYASILLEGEQVINSEIDKLPFTLNPAQKKQYDELVAKKKTLYKNVVALLEKAHTEVPDNLSIVKILRNVYIGLDDQANVKKYEDIEKKLME